MVRSKQWVLLGAPSAEKTALCKRLAEIFSLSYVSVDSEDLSVDTDALLAQLKQTQTDWILDSFPQTLDQATALKQDVNARPNLVFALRTAPAEEALEKIVKVFSCPVIYLDNLELDDDSLQAAIEDARKDPEWIDRLQAVPCLASDPSALLDISSVARKLPLERQTSAVTLLASLLRGEPRAFVADDTTSTMHAVDIYTRVEKPTQGVIAMNLAPELRAMLPFVEKLPPQALVTMAPLAHEIVQESRSGAITPATAVKVHQAFFQLSEKDRAQLVRVLPPEEKELATHVVEATEGLSPRGVETVVQLMLQTHDSQQQQQLPPRPNDYGTIASAREQPPHLPPDSVMTTLALAATKAHGRRLFRWVQSAPTSLRVLTFLSSALLLVTSIVALVLDLLSGQIAAVVVNAWIVFFALLLVSLEVKITAVEMHVSTAITAHFPLVATASGRGCFLLFVATLAVSLVAKASWQNALLCGAGVVAAVVALWSITLSSVASHQFNLLRTRIESLSELEKIFEQVVDDNDAANELDIDGLSRLCLHLKWPIDAAFLDTILRDLDLDNTNGVSLSDLQIWWSQTQIDTSVSIQMSMKAAIKPPSALKLVNWLAGVLVFTTGVVGNVVTLRTRSLGEATINVVVNLWLIVFGLLVVVLETPPSWLHLVMQLKLFMTEHFARFLDSIFGRALFYFFAGTVTISTYTADHLLPLFSGSALVLLSLVNSIVGKQAKAAFLALARTVNVSAIARIFADGDLDRDGVWSLEELDKFCTASGIQLSRPQWELLVDEMDRDHSGVISLHEFTTWVERQHPSAIDQLV
ncbi:hypothetical protein Ae201684P_010202 [Aphanomyces euteiches]|uniref:EF-hand domain-containing protein n=1 Tax=Aphanomyces euteiches TaxID=100861 RepID=A0A6G0X019_9STRA|nr:hypothetical protein Ae201684_009986 [Aphanomyces euteiches]KAH9095998.1 hypothetical protein Ae201684P_010202 [Aphanomyces euteiches]